MGGGGAGGEVVFQMEGKKTRGRARRTERVAGDERRWLRMVGGLWLCGWGKGGRWDVVLSVTYWEGVGWEGTHKWGDGFDIGSLANSPAPK